MPSRDDERHGTLGERSVDELVDGRVPDDVVDTVERLAERDRQRLRGRRPDRQRPLEARPRGHRDRVDLREVDVRLRERPADRRHHGLEVRARRDLRDDPAEARVLVHRRRDRVEQQLAAPHEGHPRLVAGRLDAKDEGFAHALQDTARTPVTCLTTGHVREDPMTARAFFPP